MHSHNSIPPRALLRIALTVLGSALFACQFFTEPKTALPEIELGTKVEGSIAAGDSIYDYLVPTDTGVFRLLLLAKSGSNSDTLVASLMDDAGRVLTTVKSSGSDTSLASNASGWLRLPNGAVSRLRIRRQAGSDGRYVVQFFRRNRAPETLGSAVTIGQVVEGEAIDVSEDVDEFRISANAGDEWVLFAQARFGLEIHIIEAARDSIVGAVASPFFDETLEFWSSGRVLLPRTGTYVLRVIGTHPLPYKFRLDAVRRAPEEQPAATALGAVLSEAIGVTGDVDEFTFTTTAGQEMNLLVQLESGMSSGLTVQVARGATVLQSVNVATPAGSIDQGGSGRFTLPSGGQYTVRAYGETRGTAAQTTGRYRVELYPVSRLVESGASIALDGPTVSEALDRPGDVDEFTIQGTAGQLAMIHLEAPVVLGGKVMAQIVGGPSGATVFATAMNASGSGVGDPDRYGIAYSYRVQLPYTGTYTIRVSGHYQSSMARGSYTLEAYTVSPLPEHVPATIQIGDTVSGEKIDRPGDLDVFTLSGQAGQEINIFLGWPGVINGEMYAHLDGSGLGLFTFAYITDLDTRGIGRLRLENKTYTWVVDPQWSAQYFMTKSQGGYAFRVFPIDRNPEGRTAAYVIGDTVSGEPLYPSGDVDEYTFQLNAPASLHVFWESDPLYGLLFNVSTGATGYAIWGNYSTYNGQPVRDISLPAGNYRLEVRNPLADAGIDQLGLKRATLTYRFAFLVQ